MKNNGKFLDSLQEKEQARKTFLKEERQFLNSLDNEKKRKYRIFLWRKKPAFLWKKNVLIKPLIHIGESCRERL